MSHFRYKAVSTSGEVIEGRMEAASEAAVIARLQGLGHLPVTAEPVDVVSDARQRPKRRALFSKSVSGKQLGIVTRELARLINAGVPLERSLEILIGVAGSEATEQLLNRILNEIRGGATLADAIEAQGPPFSRLYVNMIRAGEAGGALGVVLARLADYMARSQELRANVVSALIYPVALLAVSLLSLVTLMTLVVPRFQHLFDESGAALPVMTEVVVAVASWLQSYWWGLVVVLLAGFVLIPRLLRRPGPKLVWDRFVLAVPKVGDLVRKIEVSRFARTLGTLLTNGVPLLAALAIVKETLGNSVMAKSVGDTADSLKAGQGLASPLFEAGVFPNLAVHMVKVGEETGQLDVMLTDIADIYDEEVRNSLKNLLALLEPILILTLGVLMGGIVISILLAILSVNQLAL